MKQITQAEWDAIPDCNKDVWTTERTDLPNWEKVREKYLGKRTLLEGYCLLVEGLSFEIVPS